MLNDLVDVSLWQAELRMRGIGGAWALIAS
jgi:hypothetical protein